VRGLDRGERFVPVEPEELDGAQIVDFGHAGFHFVELRKSGRTTAQANSKPMLGPADATLTAL
jgi:hypothetical protein